MIKINKNKNTGALAATYKRGKYCGDDVLIHTETASPAVRILRQHLFAFFFYNPTHVFLKHLSLSFPLACSRLRIQHQLCGMGVFVCLMVKLSPMSLSSVLFTNALKIQRGLRFCCAHQWHPDVHTNTYSSTHTVLTLKKPSFASIFSPQQEQLWSMKHPRLFNCFVAQRL